MTNPTNTDLAAALREIADTLPLGSQLIVRLAADRLGEGDRWIEWDYRTGVQPAFYRGQRIEVKFRNGDTDIDEPIAYAWTDCNDTTIVAYRVVK